LSLSRDRRQKVGRQQRYPILKEYLNDESLSLTQIADMMNYIAFLFQSLLQIKIDNDGVVQKKLINNFEI
jgi:hypothetical protein